MTTKPLEAVDEDGVLQPLESLDLDEHQRVAVILKSAPAGAGEKPWLDVEYVRECAREADDSISLESVRRILSKIPGSLTSDFVAERAQK